MLSTSFPGFWERGWYALEETGGEINDPFSELLSAYFAEFDQHLEDMLLGHQSGSNWTGWRREDKFVGSWALFIILEPLRIRQVDVISQELCLVFSLIIIRFAYFPVVKAAFVETSHFVLITSVWLRVDSLAPDRCYSHR